MKHYIISKKQLFAQDIDIILGLPVGTTRLAISDGEIDIQVPDGTVITLEQKITLKTLLRNMGYAHTNSNEREFIG